MYAQGHSSPTYVRMSFMCTYIFVAIAFLLYFNLITCRWATLCFCFVICNLCWSGMMKLPPLASKQILIIFVTVPMRLRRQICQKNSPYQFEVYIIKYALLGNEYSWSKICGEILENWNIIMKNIYLIHNLKRHFEFHRSAGVINYQSPPLRRFSVVISVVSITASNLSATFSLLNPFVHPSLHKAWFPFHQIH